MTTGVERLKWDWNRATTFAGLYYCNYKNSVCISLFICKSINIEIIVIPVFI